MVMTTFRCEHCGDSLYWDELDYGVCSVCSEVMYDRSQKRAEWNHYHDDPCPEEELPPMPRRDQ